MLVPKSNATFLVPVSVPVPPLIMSFGFGVFKAIPIEVSLGYLIAEHE